MTEEEYRNFDYPEFVDCLRAKSERYPDGVFDKERSINRDDRKEI